MLARLLVIVFALVVVGAGVGIGYFVLGDSTSLSGVVAPLADPTAADRPVRIRRSRW